MAKRWQKVEIRYLEKHAGSKTLEELAERFHTDPATVEAKIEELRLDKAEGNDAEAAALAAYEAGMKALYAGKWKQAAEHLATVVDGAVPVELKARARQMVAVAEQRRNAGKGDTEPYLRALAAKNEERWDDALTLCDEGGKEPRFHYLAAVVRSLQGDLEEAAARLEKAVAGDERLAAHARHDPDLAALRADQRFASRFR